MTKKTMEMELAKAEAVSKNLGKILAAAGIAVERLSPEAAPVQRQFNYSALIDASDGNCTEKFSPTFSHKDWVDGEDLVQAGQSPNDVGFNVRFRQIETDLKAVQADLKTAFSCISQLRHSIRTSLTEVAAELNRLDDDIFNLQSRTTLLEENPNPVFAWARIFKPDASTATIDVASPNIDRVENVQTGWSNVYLKNITAGKPLFAVMTAQVVSIVGAIALNGNPIQCMTSDANGKLTDMHYTLVVLR
jgi:hypothetical protein